MDKIGLRHLINTGVVLACKQVNASLASTKSLGEVNADVQFNTVLDRLTQLGILLIEHNVEDLWGDLLGGLREIYRIPGFDNLVYNARISQSYGEFFLILAHRMMTLGAFAITRKRYNLAIHLVQKYPRQDCDEKNWFRYAVTLAARGDALKQKSLIPPASDYVRAKPQFFTLFNDNSDEVVDRMCQFDFFQCVAVAAHTDVDDCYPSFAVYWNHRSSPMAHAIIEQKSIRNMLGIRDDAHLAHILVELDKWAARTASAINGWDSDTWDDRLIDDFLIRADHGQER